MNMNDKITMIIYTFERHKYLERILDYYSITNLKIIIGDSTKTTFSNLHKYNNIEYYHLPDMHPIEKLNKMLKLVKSPYVVLCADDDFITPTGINESIKFLEENKDYDMAHGHYIGFNPPGNEVDPNGRFCWSPKYVFPILDFEGPVERVTHYFKDFATPLFYGVYRKNILQLMRSEAEKYTNDYIFQEHLTALISLIYSKEKHLDVLYCFREREPKEKRKWALESLASFIEEGTFNYKYERFKNCLVSHICKVTSLDSVEAEKVIDSGISKVIERRAPKPQTVKKSLSIIIKKSLKSRMPNIHRLIKSVYSKILPFKEENTGVFYDFPPPKDQEYFRYTKQGRNVCVEMPKYQDSDKKDFINVRDHVIRYCDNNDTIHIQK
jgi:glycosyltransferase domain-containing protein